jgi:GntR family transcriptional regulator
LVLRVDGRSGVPPYLQLGQQIRHAIAVGVLRPGDRLPSVKDIVAMVAVNPNTVFKALRELEHEGLLEGRPGAGTFVLRRPPGPSAVVLARLRRSLGRWVDTARVAGMDDRAINDLFQQALTDRDAGVVSA